MPKDTKTIIEWLRGKRYNDIELEPESGQVDPRLKGKSVREALEKAGKNFKELQRNSVLSGLKEAAEGDSRK